MGKGNLHRRPVPARRIPNTRTRTRLQKPKLADPEQNSHDLALQLRSLGLYAASTLGDGNCLFRALCDQLYGSPKDHLVLRRAICDWMDTHREHYQGFVEDGRTWEQHIATMRQSATYGGHLELSAFAHLKRRNVKVIQPGLVYVIEWSTGPNVAAPPQEPVASSSATSLQSDAPSTSASGASMSALSSREERRARRDRIREAKELERQQKRAAAAETTETADDETSPDDLPAIYVAYHDWEHFSSVRNLTGPHQGIPSVVESAAPEDDEPAPNPPSSLRLKPPSSRKRSLSPATTTTTAQSTDTGSTPSSVPPQTPPETLATMNAASAIFKSRSPKRSFDETEELGGDGSGSEYGRADPKRTRNKAAVRVVEEPADTPEPGFPPPGLSPSGSTDDDLDGDDEEEVVSTPDSATSTSRSSLRKRTTTTSKRSTKKIGTSRPKPKRVILLVGKKKDREAKDEETRAEAEKAEWMSNGRGKMDVRGFRELKI